MIARKIVILLLFKMLLFGSAVHADSADNLSFNLAPGDLTFDAGLAIGNAQFRLTGNIVDRVEILNISAERCLQLMWQTNDPGELQLLLDNYQKSESTLWNLWENLDNSDAELVAKAIMEGASNRTSALQEIINIRTLPRTTLAAIERAIDNQGKSIGQHKEALSRAQQARLEKLKQPAEKGSLAAGLSPTLMGGGPPSGLSDLASSLTDSFPGLFDFAPGFSGSSPGLGISIPGNFSFSPGRVGFIPPGHGGTPPGQDDDTPGKAEFCPVCGKLTYPVNNCECDEDNKPGKAEFCPGCGKQTYPTDQCICETDNEGQEEDENNGNNGSNGNNGGQPSELPGQGGDPANPPPHNNDNNGNSESAGNGNNGTDSDPDTP